MVSHKVHQVKLVHVALKYHEIHEAVCLMRKHAVWLMRKHTVCLMRKHAVCLTMLLSLKIVIEYG